MNSDLGPFHITLNIHSHLSKKIYNWSFLQIIQYVLLRFTRTFYTLTPTHDTPTHDIYSSLETTPFPPSPHKLPPSSEDENGGG